MGRAAPTVQGVPVEHRGIRTLSTPATYRDVVADPVTGRLFWAGMVSAVGDFVGTGALLVLAFERAGGRAVGAAGFLAAAGAGSLVVALVGGPLLDRMPRRGGLVGTEVVGAAAIVLPLLLAGLWPTYLAAFLLGAMRSSAVSLRHGVLADAVPERLRTGLLALFGTTDQFSQVIGFATGASLAVGLGARVALSLDLVTFVVGAMILAGLTVPSRHEDADRSTLSSGWTTLFGHPQLRLLTLLVMLSTAATALPETLATAAVGTSSPWLPVVLAAGPAGGVLGYAVAGRMRSTLRFQGQLAHLTLFGAVVATGALVSGPIGLTLVNVGAGAGAAWIVGPQVAFVRLAPAARISQVMAAMVALVVMTEGAWVLLAGVAADRYGIRTAYGLAAAVVSVAAVAGWLVHARRGQDRERWDPEPTVDVSPSAATVEFTAAGGRRGTAG